MASTLPPNASARKYGTEPRVGHESRAVTYAARGMGLRPGTVGQMIRTRGIHVQVARLIEAALLLQDDALFQRLTAPILAAIAQRPLRTFTPELENEVQQADLAEDAAEAIYQALKSAESRRAWLARKRQSHVLEADLIRALEALDA